MRTTLGILFTCLLAFGASAASFVHGPYSGAPSADSLAISWLSSERIAARVEYSLLSQYELSGAFSDSVDAPLIESGAASQTEHVVLQSLEPDAEYVYRVVLDGSGNDEEDVASALGHFVTEPPSGRTVSFAIVSDTQWQWEGDNRLAAVGNAVAADKTPFDFVLHAGDIVESPAAQYWDHWFASFGSMLLRAPFIPVLGNHEGNHRSYYDNFAHPPGGGKQDERWWALHWGDVVVVGLDTNVTRAADYIAQQEWVRQHLSGPEPHRIVMFHHPVYSSDAYHRDDYALDKIFHRIFADTGVDLVINGHAHSYERSERDGVTYVVAGGGGAVPSELADVLVDESAVAIEGYNFYLRVEASLEGLAVEAVSVAQATEDAFRLTDGHLLDSFNLPPDAPARAISTWLLVLMGLSGAAIVGFVLMRGLHR